MKLEYAILCTLAPHGFLAQPHEHLEWDSARRTGTFASLALSLRELEPSDRLPDPSWASRVVAVILAVGPLTSDAHHDAFDEWSVALADATKGAIYNQWRGELAYVANEDAPHHDALTWAEPAPAPPPPPARLVLLDGRTIVAFEEDDTLGLRAPKGHVLAPPVGKRLPYIFPWRLVRATMERIAPPGWAAVRLYGDFSVAQLPDELVLEPVLEDEAAALVAILAERYALPRRPRATARYELAGARPLEAAYIVTVGTYAPGHFEGPDFEGAKLEGDAARLAPLIPGQRYCVTGFYQPPVSSPIVGFGGPTIHVMSIAPEPEGPRRSEDAPRWVMPASPSRRGPVLALLHPTEERGHEQAELSTRPDPSTLVVAALDAAGGQGTSAAAARVAQLTLATVLAEPDYVPHLGPPVEPPAWVFDGLSAWVSWLVERGPLPHEPDALAIALGNRIGAVLEGVNLRGCAMSAWGIVAVIRSGRATLVRRGMARAYLVRDGELQPLVYEHVLGREPAVLAQPELAAAMAEHAWVMVSSFAPVDPPAATPPLELEVRPGDRLVFVVGQEVLEALADPARERLLSAAVPDVTLGMPPTPAMLEHGWGVVAVDVEPW